MAYIATIKDVAPIQGKDRIQYVSFNENGYGVIADKSFSVGDKVVYIEVDAILPVKPQFEFLRKRCFKEELNGFLIKNMKMCGVYSNGIIFDMSFVKKQYKPGTDVTDELGIRKYEPEDDASPKEDTKKLFHFLMSHKITRIIAKLIYPKANICGDFPVQYIAKSDETNIQNEKQMFDKWIDISCYVTRKMEGQSVTMIMIPKGRKYETRIYSRNSIGNESHFEFAKKIKLDDIFALIWKTEHKRYAFQGEFCSPSVQKGIYKNGTHFYVYTVKDIDENKMLDFESYTSICKRYGFETVPKIVSHVSLKDLFGDVTNMQDYTERQWFKVGEDPCLRSTSFDDIDGKKYSKPEYHRWEGIVVRGLNNEFSFKVKSNEYALEGL